MAPSRSAEGDPRPPCRCPPRRAGTFQGDLPPVHCQVGPPQGPDSHTQIHGTRIAGVSDQWGHGGGIRPGTMDVNLSSANQISSPAVVSCLQCNVQSTHEPFLTKRKTLHTSCLNRLIKYKYNISENDACVDGCRHDCQLITER